MIGRRTLLAVGSAVAIAAADVDEAAAAADRTVRVQHNSLQYSDSVAAHRHDADAVFRHARRVGNDLVSGTESSRSNSLWGALPAAADRHGFALFHHPFGEWTAVDRRFGSIVDRGFVPVIAGSGLPARDGGHAPRGIVWIRVRPHQRGIGPIAFGVSHWLTQRSEDATNVSNRRIVRAVNRWARRHGRGRRIVFYAADTNTDDGRRDLFNGGPLTTCWDEIHRHPGTRGAGTIDVIASLDWDRRVSCRWASCLGDGALYLASDHRMIEAAYRVRSHT